MSNCCLASYQGSSCNCCYYGSHPYYISMDVPSQDSIHYSYQLSPDLNYINNFPTRYDNLISTQFQISPSVNEFTDPNLVQFYPISHEYSKSYYTNYLSSSKPEIETNHQVVIAADTGLMSEDEDDDFPEYDPTPYGGGYDQILTYGQPLPPSVKICYPRSTLSNHVHDLSSNDNYSSNVVPPYGGQDDYDPHPLGKPIREDRKPVKTLDVHEEKEISREIAAEKFEPVTLGNGGDYKQVSQFPPYGYGLEAMDLCEGLFGYWPCLTKELRSKLREEAKQDAPQEEYQYWSYAQDYIFGNLTPYGHGELREEEDWN